MYLVFNVFLVLVSSLSLPDWKLFTSEINHTLELKHRYIENGVGMNAYAICEKSGPFPSVMKVLREYDKK